MMNEREVKILTDRLIPVPEKIEFVDGDDYIIENKCRVAVKADDIAGTGEKVKKLFYSY